MKLRSLSSAPRRPRTFSARQAANQAAPPGRGHLTPTFIVSPPALLAVATVSLVALKTLLPRDHPLFDFIRRGVVLRRRCQRSVIRFVSQSRRNLISGLTPTLANPLQFENGAATASNLTTSMSEADKTVLRLDEMRDRAIAQLENECIASSTTPASSSVLSNAEFAALPALQRRELLASTFAAMQEDGSDPSAWALAAAAGGGSGGPYQRGKNTAAAYAASSWRTPTAGSSKEEKESSTAFAYWRAAESLNGRAAALGFVICLAREIIEPGHPSLFEQVVDVVVPIAQSTPPFLVAVCDRIADLLT